MISGVATLLRMPPRRGPADDELDALGCSAAGASFGITRFLIPPFGAIVKILVFQQNMDAPGLSL